MSPEPNKKLVIAIASGKGGTGKTTIAAGLTKAIADMGKSVAYLDCDVEEPNGHIFFQPEIENSTEVKVLVPEIEMEKCTFCGECSKICRFNAIAVLKEDVMVFPSLCHSCGGCFLICPEKAIKEVPRKIGLIRNGHGYGAIFYEGRLDVGEALSPPLTRELKKVVPGSEVIILDSPPGTSCPVIAAVTDSDYVILVTEPTPFGLHDLKLAAEMTRALKLPFGVVINRADIGDTGVEDYCRTKNIDVLLRIPFDRRIAEAYSRGNMLSSAGAAYSDDMNRLYIQVENKVITHGNSHS